jgi:hypothetical protein
MSDLMKIVWVSAFTVLGSIVVFVVGQVASRFFVEQIHEQSKAISEIIDSLIFFADLYSNPDNRNPPSAEKERGEASKTLRRHASQLSSKTLFSGTPDDAREFRNQILKGLNLPFI